MNKKKGTLITSLDFELLWGMTDKSYIDSYKENVLGVWDAIPQILSVFDEYGVHATWATVGMLAHDSYASLEKVLPTEQLRPRYSNPHQSSYFHLESKNLSEYAGDQRCYFGDELIKKILTHSHQEIASHTFSHMYALDMENDDAAAKADCIATNASLEKYNIKPKSLVFPRNQINDKYISHAVEVGILCYRGNPKHFFYRARTDKNDSLVIRALRLLDNYLNLSGHHTYTFDEVHKTFPYKLSASRFLRPFTPKLSMFEGLRLRRIKKSMTYAARKGEVFHLWWHPHNFGKYTEENLAVLREILSHFEALKEQYGMETKNMEEIAVEMHGQAT